MHSLREWLNSKQRETRRGRAELCLAERSALWNSKPENRHLPSWWEHAGIRWLTRKRRWTEPQRKMMGQAARVHFLRGGLIVLLLAIVTFFGENLRHSLREQAQAKENSTRAEGLVRSLVNAEITQVPFVIAEIEQQRESTDPRLIARFAEASDKPGEKLRLALALLPVDKEQIPYLSEQLTTCSLPQFAVVRDALAPYKEELTQELWGMVMDDQHDASQRFQAAAALANYVPNDARWEQVAPFVAHHLTSKISTVSFGQWLNHFRAASHQLTPVLENLNFDENRPSKQRETATLALAVYWRRKPEKLTQLILATEELTVFDVLIEALRPYARQVNPGLVAKVQAPLPANSEAEERDAHWQVQAMAAVTLVHLGYGEDVWPMLKITPDPSLRSFIIQGLGKFQTNQNVLAARLEVESDVSIRRALIQSLGGLDASRIPASDRTRIANQLAAIYVNDIDPGLHSSVAWALDQWDIERPSLNVTISAQLDEERKQRKLQLSKRVDEAQSRLDAYERNELPGQQALWERNLNLQALALPDSLNDELITHFPLDESNGQEAANSIAGQHKAVYQGTGHPEWVPGVIGGALKLNADGEFVGVGPVSPNKKGPISYGCWVHCKPIGPAVLLATRRPPR
ncbi:MAG: HEAT repeat domain-containing protein [Planctomycetaceae bacterium]|nr:HEAT repeat domain-containing protein [Planctomycetaceae bacterium]